MSHIYPTPTERTELHRLLNRDPGTIDAQRAVGIRACAVSTGAGCQGEAQPMTDPNGAAMYGTMMYHGSHQENPYFVSIFNHIYIYTYIYICDFVEDHKGRESSNSFGGFQGSPKPQPVPLTGPDRPPGPLVTLLDLWGCPQRVSALRFFAPRGLEPCQADPCNVEGWNAYASGSDHPRWVISSGKIHTGIFFFWMSTPYRLSFIKCCFWQRNPLCRDLAV